MTDFVYELDRIINNLSPKANIGVNLVGDTNIDLNKRDAHIKPCRDPLRRHDLRNIIKTHTDYTPHTGRSSLIDHFAIDNAELYSQADICQTDESDHCIIHASRKKFKTKSRKEKLRARKYDNLNEEDFAREVEMHNWTRVLGCKS